MYLGPKPTIYSPTFAEITSWKRQVVDELSGWHRDVNKIDAKQAEAFKAGAEQGIQRMLACLRLHGALAEYASK